MAQAITLSPGLYSVPRPYRPHKPKCTNCGTGMDHKGGNPAAYSCRGCGTKHHALPLSTEGVKARRHREAVEFIIRMVSRRPMYYTEVWQRASISRNTLERYLRECPDLFRWDRKVYTHSTPGAWRIS